VVTGGPTYDNAANLAPAFLDQIVRRYEGTRLGRQEISGELLTDIPGALWSLGLIDAHRSRKAPELVRVAIGVDPQAAEGDGAAETGIVVAGKDAQGHGYVLADLTLSGSPHAWASRVVKAFHDYK